jgi:hypothetical protein
MSAKTMMVKYTFTNEVGMPIGKLVSMRRTYITFSRLFKFEPSTNKVTDQQRTLAGIQISRCSRPITRFLIYK